MIKYAVKWLYRYQSFKPSKVEVVDLLYHIRKGNLEVFRYLCEDLEIDISRLKRTLLSNACKFGQLKLIVYLHQNWPLNTQELRDVAPTLINSTIRLNNRLKILQYLVGNMKIYLYVKKMSVIEHWIFSLNHYQSASIKNCRRILLKAKKQRLKQNT